MHHQKLLLIAIRVGLIGTISALGRNFPLNQVTSPECRGQNRDELSENCKLNILKEASDPETSKLLFSALRGTSYETPQKLHSGGHPSLDMATSEGTPVYAIQDGTVIKAGEIAGYGNSITIKHNIEGKIFYSNYSHLHDILVSVGQNIQGGALIGKVGCTGFTISGDKSRCGYHLDFQITTDKSPAHPYGYHDCIGGGYYEAVNKGLCADKLKEYTIDPLVFFQTYAHINIHVPLIDTPPSAPATSSEQSPSTPTKKRPTLQEIYARLKQQNQNILADRDTTTQSSVITDRLQNETTTHTINSLATSVQIAATPTTPAVGGERIAVFDQYTIQWSRNMDPSSLSEGKVITLTITITDKFGNPVTTVLPYPIGLTINNTIIGDIFPSTFSSVVNGKKYIFLQTKNLGKATLILSIGEHQFGTETLVVK